jgi:hypothetical protein
MEKIILKCIFALAAMQFLHLEAMIIEKPNVGAATRSLISVTECEIKNGLLGMQRDTSINTLLRGTCANVPNPLHRRFNPNCVPLNLNVVRNFFGIDAKCLEWIHHRHFIIAMKELFETILNYGVNSWSNSFLWYMDFHLPISDENSEVGLLVANGYVSPYAKIMSGNGVLVYHANDIANVFRLDDGKFLSSFTIRGYTTFTFSHGEFFAYNKEDLKSSSVVPIVGNGKGFLRIK